MKWKNGTPSMSTVVILPRPAAIQAVIYEEDKMYGGHTGSIRLKSGPAFKIRVTIGFTKDTKKEAKDHAEKTMAALEAWWSDCPEFLREA